MNEPNWKLNFFVDNHLVYYFQNSCSDVQHNSAKTIIQRHDEIIYQS